MSISTKVRLAAFEHAANEISFHRALSHGNVAEARILHIAGLMADASDALHMVTKNKGLPHEKETKKRAEDALARLQSLDGAKSL